MENGAPSVAGPFDSSASGVVRVYGTSFYLGICGCILRRFRYVKTISAMQEKLAGPSGGSDPPWLQNMTPLASRLVRNRAAGESKSAWVLPYALITASMASIASSFQE